MNQSEILKEFWRDYNGVIRSRLFGWINGHARKIKSIQGKSDNWVRLSETRLVKTGGNIYHCRVKAKILKDGSSAFISTTYVIVNDSTTGRNIVYLLPAEKDNRSLIVFDSHFFYRYCDLVLHKSLSFEKIVDSFMDSGVTFHIRTTENWKDFRPNFEVTLGDGIFGIGECNLDDYMFKVNTCVTKELIEQWRRELGLDETISIINVYSEHKNSSTKKDSVEIVKEKSQKELEIEQAWKEYYGK